MSRRILLSLALVVPAVLLLTGADSITETKVTPNPGGVRFTVYGEGKYTLENNFVEIDFTAEYIANGQDTTLKADTDSTKLTWDGTLTVAPGGYECFGTLYTMKGMTKIVTESNQIYALVN